MATEWQDKQLADLLRSARVVPKPGAKQKAMAAMAEAARHAAPRARVAAPRKRLLAAGVFVAVVVATGFRLFPGRHGFALADVAEAMANVKNVHFIGWGPNQRTGGRDRMEGWVEPRRARVVEGDTLDQFLDEHAITEIRWESDHPRVTIYSLPQQMEDQLKEGEGFLRALPFLWPQAAQDALERSGKIVTNWNRQQLSDGRPVIGVDLTGGEETTRLTVDEATNLVLQIEEYRNGALRDGIEQIEYNVDIPEEVFQVSIPENATVVNTVTSPLEEPGQEPETPTQLKPKEKYSILESHDGRGGAWIGPFHRHLRFETVGDHEATVTYTPRTNVYRVTGKVRVLGMRLNTIVENSEFVAPRPPDVTAEQYEAKEAQERREAMRRMQPPEVWRQWEAKAKELAAAGAQGLGTTGGTLELGDWGFYSLNAREIQIWYLRTRNAFYVMGKAHVRGPGVDQAVEDGWIKVPGPPPNLK